MSKEEQNKQPRRYLNTPGYTAIHGYANSINQLVQFLKWHCIWAGVEKDAMDSVLIKSEVVENLCQQKVDLNKIYKYISN